MIIPPPLQRIIPRVDREGVVLRVKADYEHVSAGRRGLLVVAAAAVAK